MKRRLVVAGALHAWWLVTAIAWTAESSRVPRFPWLPAAPPLPKAAGKAIRVTTVDELFAAAERVEPGGTILVADGHYLMPRYFELHTDDVTLRGESGRRENVLLDGAQSQHGELVGISRCSGITIADLTIQNIKWNGFKINSDRGASRVTIHNCVIHNIWQRGIKGPAVPQQNRDTMRPTGCRVQHCLFYNDRAKQFSDDPSDTPEGFGGNYIGGIDIMFAKGWTISDNVFYHIQGRTREARGAIFVWHDSQDCIIERNVIVDCDSGICLGNSHRGFETSVHCTNCIVRNNFVVRCPENGILADYTRDCKIVQNSIHDPNSRLQRLIRIVHDNDGLVVANNLLNGPAMRMETQGALRIQQNRTGDMTHAFEDPLVGDLHLKAREAATVGTAERLNEAGEDIDRQARRPMTALGADEPEG